MALSRKQFKRTVEDFICESCGRNVSGNGYTNHCPYCLYSKHVDENPGDRRAECGGLMKPVAIETRAGHFIVVHKCRKCGVHKRNKSAAADSREQLIRISRQFAAVNPR
jgi:RNHCP domain